ncbi:hypothetical protein [Brevundimonas sp. NIBR10]|uniref:hypothetical protein n=1 Tax=Brevundimonas sp. NIBR10 TaxID=3015997 RepID=UPI0022F17245|nr:hypothetical protein [Brevundimonas sp. NIBR10]
MTEGRQTVAGAYAKIEGHERECALRYEALGNAILDVKNGLKWAINLAVLILISLFAWMAMQLYGYMQRDIAAARTPPPAVATVGLPKIVTSFQGPVRQY